MIVGNPEAVEAAARDLGTSGTTLVETGETVGHHADTLDTNWSGTASGAATRVVGELARRIGAGGAPCSSVDAALITYAQALRDAQREWAAANADAQAGATALASAKADGADARAIPAGQEIGPTGVNASNAAAQRATAAQKSASDSIDAAKDAMADIVATLAQANQAAADIVVTATEQLAEMAGTGAAEGGPAEAIREGRARRADDARADSAQPDSFGDQVQNVIGGGGDGLWKIGPGAAGSVLGFIPWGVGNAIEGTVDGWHDDLEDWYGADTESAAYKGASGTVQVASLAIPGMGVVKVGRVIGAARGARALGVAGSAAKTAGAVRAAPAAAIANLRAARVHGAAGAAAGLAQATFFGQTVVARSKGWEYVGARKINLSPLSLHKEGQWARWEARANTYLKHGFDEDFVTNARKFAGVRQDEITMARPSGPVQLERLFGAGWKPDGLQATGARADGLSWTPLPVEKMGDPRMLLGLPPDNPVRFHETGLLIKPENVFHVRPALRVGDNLGGGLEYLVWDPASAVPMRYVSGVNEAFTQSATGLSR